MRAAPQPRLTPLAEAATALGMDYWKLWGACVRGEVPHVRLGSRLFLKARTLRQLLERPAEPEPASEAVT